MSLPKVGLCIATYLESNQKYLDECLKSIKNLNFPKELLDVVVVGSGDYIPNTHGYRSIHRNQQTHYPEACNIGVSSFSADCEYYLLLNDDTILTKNSLIKLLSSASPDAIYQPISNCDNGWRYQLKMPLGLNKRFYRYEQILEHKTDTHDPFQKMMDADSLYPQGMIIVDWVPFYATLIPKRIWNFVGPLDPRFKTGQDDIDYGRRAKAKGVPCAINLSSLIWHFGGVTADQVLTDDIRKENIDYFEMKHGEKLI